MDLKVKKNDYIQYAKSGLEDYYNEIYRLLYRKDKNRKTQEKRRTYFEN